MYGIPIRRLTADISVAPQMEPTDVAQVVAAGFKSIVNNRPDFESDPHQPTSAAIEAAATAAGLSYRFLPVASGYQTPEQAAQLATLLEELPKPVLLFCRSGARSTRLFVSAMQLPR